MSDHNMRLYTDAIDEKIYIKCSCGQLDESLDYGPTPEEVWDAARRHWMPTRDDE